MERRGKMKMTEDEAFAIMETLGNNHYGGYFAITKNGEKGWGVMLGEDLENTVFRGDTLQAAVIKLLDHIEWCY